jgi:hypothetical protein
LTSFSLLRCKQRKLEFEQDIGMVSNMELTPSPRHHTSSAALLRPPHLMT